MAGGLNLYGFANGDPVNFSDPFGLCPVPQLCAAALGAALGAGSQVLFNAIADRPLSEGVGAAALGGALIGATFGAAAPEATTAFFARSGVALGRGASAAGAAGSAAAKGIDKLDDVLGNPNVLRGKTPADLGQAAGRSANWVQGTLGKGAHKGQGAVWREVNAAGNLTGRMIQWHPGGGHHGPNPYWKVSTGEGGITRIF